MIDPYKKQVITNLKKAKGQIDYILKMIEEERYCVDIATQTNAVMGLLRKANNYILESHLTTCGLKNFSEVDASKKEAFIKELVRTFTLTNK